MPEFPETNESLIVQVRDPSNRAAWEQFEQLYRPVIFRIARAKGLCRCARLGSAGLDLRFLGNRPLRKATCWRAFSKLAGTNYLPGFGPASAFSKRLRESRQRLARIATSMESRNSELVEFQRELSELLYKQRQTAEDDALRRNFLPKITAMESSERAKKQELESLNAEKKCVDAELAEAQREHQVILQLLQTNLAAAKRQLEFKQVFEQRMQFAFKEGQLKLMELDQAKQALAEAESELQQLTILYEFYSNIGKEEVEQKAPEQPSSEQPTPVQPTPVR